MRRSSAVIALALALSAAALAVACGGSGEPKDLTKVYDTITFFPGSTIDGGPVAPAALIYGDSETFKNDRRMFVSSGDATKEMVLDYYSQEIPKLGWTKEDPPKPKAKDMKDYCGVSGAITCLSFLKDGIRMIVSAPIQLQLNPLAPVGVSYHIHLEGR